MVDSQEKVIVPTILVGVRENSTNILSRVRRLVEETYGRLKNFPILGFLILDTDKDYKVNSPEAADSQFKESEKYWARISGREVSDMVTRMGNYPWIHQQLDLETSKNFIFLS